MSNALCMFPWVTKAMLNGWSISLAIIITVPLKFYYLIKTYIWEKQDIKYL